MSVADKNIVRSKYGALTMQLEQKILAKLSELQSFAQLANTKGAEINAKLEKAASRLAQAEADANVV